MTAIQDQVINTRGYRKHILKESQLPDDRCRKCRLQAETIQHITSACKLLAQTDYLHRHNQVANIVHQKLALKHKLTDSKEPYYKYVPQTVLENTTHKLYFDRAIITDKTIHHNRPDITLIDKQKKTTFIIDVAIPNTHNIETTLSNKVTKYIDLSQEVKRIWKMDKVVIVPVIISATGVIPHKLLNSLSVLDIPKSTYITLQKATILNTCHIVRKFLNDTTER